MQVRFEAVQQNVTKFTAMAVINLGTPKVAA